MHIALIIAITQGKTHVPEKINIGITAAIIHVPVITLFNIVNLSYTAESSISVVEFFNRLIYILL